MEKVEVSDDHGTALSARTLHFWVSFDFLSHTAKGNPNCYTAPDERAKTTDEQHQKIKLKVLEFNWEKYDD